MANVVDLPTGRQGAGWAPKHLDEKVAVYLKRHPEFDSPIIFLLNVLNGQIKGADTIEDKIDAAKTLLPYFHSKAPVIEAEDISKMKDAIDNIKTKQMAELQSQFSRLNLNVRK